MAPELAQSRSGLSSASGTTIDQSPGERGPDVSGALTWYPVVTFFQLGMDMALSLTSPLGHGHVYAPADYIDAWMALVEPQGWSPEQIARLKDDTWPK